MSPPLVALWHTTKYYFLHNTYHLWKWSCLCTCFLPLSLLFMEYKQNGVVGGLLSVFFAVSFLAAMTVSGCCQMLSVYLWNEWVDGLINTLMAHYFLSHAIPKPHGDSWLMLLPALQNPVIHCHVYGHYLCIPTCSPLPFAFTPGLSQTTLSFLRTDAPLHFPEGSAQGLSDNSSYWSSLHSCSNAFHMILVYLGQVQTQTPALNSKPHAYSVFLIHAWFMMSEWMNEWVSKLVLEVLKSNCRGRN